MARLSLPTTGRLSPSLLVDPTNAAVIKALNRLSRPSLLSLALDWLDEGSQSLCPPVLRIARPDDDDEDDGDGDLYPPARDLSELQELYSGLQTRKGSKREIVDRIIEGDWRDGLSLYQLAMVDLQYLYDHPGSLRWSAYHIQRLQTPNHEDDAENQQKPDRLSLTIPRFHPSTFLQNLQAEVLPDVKAHYNIDRPNGLALTLIRIFILDSPYNTMLAASNRTGDRSATSFDASRTIYIAFPDASPYVYISKGQTTGATTTGESRSLRSLIVEGVPKALSRPQERYALRPTSMATKNLEALLYVKGQRRTNAAGGGWSIYAKQDRKSTAQDSPLNAMLPTPPLSDVSSTEDIQTKDTSQDSRQNPTLKRKLDAVYDNYENAMKRARVTAQARFGFSGEMDDGKGIERLDILIEDPFSRQRNRSENEHDDEQDDDIEDDVQRSVPAKGRRSNVDKDFVQTSLDADEDEDQEDDAGPRNTRRTDWRPRIRLTFHGSHVFAGLRQLAEAGIVDGERMPGWMTGEEGVTIGAVRDGRIRGHKGAGLA